MQSARAVTERDRAASEGIPSGESARESPAGAPSGLDRATAFAPASVGNVAIGFDILGMAVDALGDRVTVSRSTQPGVRITAIRGGSADLPLDPARNTAG